jgi:hypothetical protein
VYFNPEDPGQSVLETGPRFQTYVSLSAGLFMLATAPLGILVALALPL